MRKSRLSKEKQARLIEHFVAGTTARTAAALAGVNKSTSAYYFHRLRKLIYRAIEDEVHFAGEVELDESYFGGRRKGRRGRGAAGIGILKRGGKVYTIAIPDTKSNTLMNIIQEKIVPGQYRLHGFLSFKHYRINHGQLFSHKHNHINGI